MIETLDLGGPKTPFLKVGDSIEIEAFTPGGVSPFGVISQRVVAPGGPGGDAGGDR
jgi:fumarylacetoacetate (FAA) hydrolase